MIERLAAWLYDSDSILVYPTYLALVVASVLIGVGVSRLILWALL